MSGLFAENLCYVKHETQLKQLHKLIAEGKGDSDEADALRNAMDTTWRPLTEAEGVRVSGLSADLYMLQDKEVFEPADGRTKIQIGQAIYAAMNKEKWEEALQLMRRPNLVPRQRIAAFRARAYEELGYHDTALLFLNYAIERATNPQGYLVMKLLIMSQLGYADEVAAQAEKLLTQASLPAFMQVIVVFVLARVAKYLPASEARSTYIRVAGLLEKILAEDALQPRNNKIITTIHVFIGYCYLMQEDIASARLSYQRAFDIDHNKTVEQLLAHLSQTDPELPFDKESYAASLDSAFGPSVTASIWKFTAVA